MSLLNRKQYQIPNHIDHLFNCLSTLIPRASVHIKETKTFCYLTGNQAFMDGYGLKSSHDFIDKTIFDMAIKMGNRWPRDMAERITHVESEIAKTKIPLIAEEEQYIGSDGLLVVNSLNKIPLFYENEEHGYILTVALNQRQLISKNSLRQLYNKFYGKKDAVKYFLLQLGLTRFVENSVLGRRNITDRELDCLVLLASGKSMKETGNRLSISFRTVEKHMEHIKQKCCFDATEELLEEFSDRYFNI